MDSFPHTMTGIFTIYIYIYMDGWYGFCVSFLVICLQEVFQARGGVASWAGRAPRHLCVELRYFLHLKILTIKDDAKLQSCLGSRNGMAFGHRLFSHHPTTQEREVFVEASTCVVDLMSFAFFFGKLYTFEN